MNILYATDGSRGALAAGHLLGQLPLPSSSRITLLHVSPGIAPDAGQIALDAARGALHPSQAEIEELLREGHPAEQILLAAVEVGADLIAVGASGHSAIARFFVGSVSERVARHATCPILVARPKHTELNQVLLGVDGSASSAQAAAFLKQLPLPAACEVRVMAVSPRLEELVRVRTMQMMPAFTDDQLAAYMEKECGAAQERVDAVAASLADAGKNSSTWVQFGGDPAEALTQAAEVKGSGLIVLGHEDRTGLEHYFLGSVSEKVVRHAHTSVLVVRGGPLAV